MDALFALVIIGSSALGLLLLASPRRARGVRMRTAALGIGVCAAALLFGEDARAPLPVSWLPGQVPASLVLAAPAQYLVVGLLIWAALSLWQSADLPPPKRVTYGPGLTLITCSLTIFALTVDHFLLRYIALELVALVVAVCMTVALPAYRGFALLWRAYLPWRLAGEGLLLSILMLDRETGTLSIYGALGGAEGLAQSSLVVVGLGAGLAAWVKLGLPPYHGWLLDGAKGPKDLWPIGNALPLLAAYLLHHFADVVTSLRLWGGAILTAAALLLLTAWLSSRQSRGRFTPAGLAYEWWPVWHGALALPMVALGLGRAYLVTFLPLRYALSHYLPAPEEVASPRRAERVDAQARRPTVVRLIVRLEYWLQGLNDVFVDAVQALSRRIQALHGGRLRANLLWATLAVAGIILLAALTWGGLG